ncbi:hypothetical protein glysoja_026705 [Glycine soja]|nr:hypothetical protein glysoja_026705 [Glycine soja]
MDCQAACRPCLYNSEQCTFLAMKKCIQDHTLYNTKPRENTFQQEKIRHKSLKRGAMLEHFQHQMPVHKSPKDELQMNKIVKPRKAYLVVDQ